MVEAFIGIGSNLGDRKENVRKAIHMLQESARVLAVSSMYESEPLYYENQGWFINCVAKIETGLSPRGLLRRLKGIERSLGRKKGVRYGPRVIDLDILFYGDRILAEDDLAIPHPRIQERRFVLAPLAEIEPNLLHPALRRTASQLLEGLHLEGRAVRLSR